MSAHAAQLAPAAISAGAARLDNGSLANIGQPLVGVFGSPASGIGGSAGIVSALRRTIGPPTPNFESVTFRGANGVRIALETEPGWMYEIEASIDLINWTPIWATNAPSGSVIFEDVDAFRFERRFYRVLAY